MSFLKAEWRKLIMINYQVDPKILKKYIPFGTELDFFKEKCYVSLVGFMFLNTKLLGFKIPFHINFEEVNLRFYVKRKTSDEIKRGVVFIKEIVPKPALTFVANTVYKENYVTLPMNHNWKESESNLNIEYSWYLNNQKQYINVISESIPEKIIANSKVEFIAEHYWGYSKLNDNKATEYEVKHPKWKQYKIKDYYVDVDFKSNYGDDFKNLNIKTPDSVMLLEGSEISVENKKIIK